MAADLSPDVPSPTGGEHVARPSFRTGRPPPVAHPSPWIERRRGAPDIVLWAAVLAVVHLSGVVAPAGFGPRPVPIAGSAAAVGPAGAVAAPGPQPLPPLPQLRPVGLTMPSIGVAATGLVDLRRLPTGELAAPEDFERVGWFADGVAPGSPGPAVIAGHVDSRTGPAVFHRLRELHAGDPIDVTLSDGTHASFTVDGVERYPKDAFPTTAVYGPVPGSALRLITCGGEFDRATRSYRDNIVVYASAAEA